MIAKRVAIIGAGASGLTAIKCCLDEGLEPICFEKSSLIGGLWHYRDDRDGHGSVFQSTVINTSKEMMCYSDCPIPKEYPNYMHNTYVQMYLERYAAEFGLVKYIRLRNQVEHLDKCANFLTTGQWKVTYTNCENGSVTSEVFDAVMVCNGHHSDPHVATFPGQETFGGIILHTHDYKDFKGFEGKRIVVVGVGNSGGDAAVELSRHAKQVFLSTRRGAWILPRLSVNGFPSDIINITRFTKMIPHFILKSVFTKQLNKWFDHANYGLQPTHDVTAQHPTVNDELPNRIISGFLKVKSNIKRITKTAVEFDDGTREDNIDVIVMATGYTFSFPFIDDSIIKVDNNQVSLYKYVLPVGLTVHTLAVIGLAQPWGAIMPISELQSRWATRLFTGAIKAPSSAKMLQDISWKKELMEKRYVDTSRHTLQVDWIPYMDDVAVEFGAKPNLFKLFVQDPLFSLRCFFGACYPYQYRLMGPGKWTGAKKAINTAMDRIVYPTRTRVVQIDNTGRISRPTIYKSLVIFVLFVAAIIKYFCR